MSDCDTDPIFNCDQLFKNNEKLTKAYLQVIDRNRQIEIDGTRWPLDLITTSIGHHEDDRSASITKIPEIPHKMPISGRRGSRKLETLRRRAEFLQSRITAATPEKNMNYDKAELAAIEWAIKTIIMYEDLLKKGHEEDGKEETPDGRDQTGSR